MTFWASHELLRLAGLAMGMALLVGAGTYVGLRLKATHRVQTDLELLQQRFDQALLDNDTEHKNTQARLDEIERFLFGDVLALIGAPQANSAAVPAVKASSPTAVQLWQRNRDRELRDRLDALERIRMRNELRIEQLEREIREIRREIR